MTAVVDFPTGSDLPDWYDRTEAMNDRDTARERRCASRKKATRLSSGGDCSNFEGDRSRSRGDRSNSRGAREKTDAPLTYQ